MDIRNLNVHNPFCAKLLVSGTIYDLVFACLSPKSLVRVASTCLSTYKSVAKYKNRAFNVNVHFSRYFSNPIAFRSLQARTNTLVSGSNALQFLDRTFYPESDLDIYTHPGHSFEVAKFLAEDEGYHYVPRESQERDWKEAIPENWDGTQRRVVVDQEAGRVYPKKDIRAVWTFEKTGRNEECLTVQIIEATSSPVESILGFHSTCVMNFISSDAAYSLYPIATFEERSAMCLPAENHSTDVISKYVNRGWRIYNRPTPRDKYNSTEPPFFLAEERWVGDRITWVLPLDMTGVKGRVPLSPSSAPLTFDPVLFNGWRLHPKSNLETNGWECVYFPLQSTVFRYNYAIPDEQLLHRLRDWTVDQGRYCHTHLSKEDWLWFDEDLPKFVIAPKRES